MAEETATMVTLTDVAQDRADAAVAADDLVVTDNDEKGVYEAKIGDETVAGVVYTRSGDHITLLATSVYPQHRGKGIAGRLLGRVLEDLKTNNETATVSCPFATTYLNTHPEYRSVIASKGTA